MITVFELLYGKVENITEEIEYLIEFESEIAKILREHSFFFFLKLFKYFQ